MRVTIVSPAWPYRGGIAAFTERLAVELQREGHQVQIYTFTLQYPGFLFPGKTQYTSSPKPEDLQIERQLSSVNPWTWISLGRRIRKEQPDLLLVAYWMSFMAPSLGTMCRIVRRNKHTRILGIMHNLLPHERKLGDKLFARYMVGALDGVVALSQSVCDEAHLFRPELPTVASPHPLYDNFGEPATREESCRQLGLDTDCRYLLFFGLIRDYKGLDWLLEAFAKLKKSPASDEKAAGVKLIIAGEFYGKSEQYFEQAKALGLEDCLVWKSEFVPDSAVRYYFGAADLIVQPYKTATQSGVTQIAYHFLKPMLVTRVGGLAEIVPDGKVGYSVEPNVEAIAAALQDFVTHSDNDTRFQEGLIEEKKKYAWDKMTHAILSLT